MNNQEVLLYADKAFACISGHEHEAELSELVTEQILEMVVETQLLTDCATD